MFVNVPGRLPGLPATRPVTLISALPGITSHAAYLGLNGEPVVHGRVDLSFLTNSVNGTLDGEWYRQDRLTVLAGRLPTLASTSQVMLTPSIARLFGTHLGGRVTYAFRRVGPDGVPAGPQVERSYRVAAIVEVPPALVDQSDQAEGSILPPSATRQLLADYLYAWVGLRLNQGAAGIPALQHHLAGLASTLQRGGAVQPPTTSGRPLAGANQIELGTATLRQLGKQVGDSVSIGARPFTRTVTIAGTVTLPSFGLATADHVSLGRGAMLPEATLLAAEGATGAQATKGAQAQPALPSAVAIDLAPAATAAQRAHLVHRIVSANPDRTPGGTYELSPPPLAATVVNTQ